MTHVDKPIVALVGRPNVGKSTLFNRLVGRARSIVMDQPGVTRDRIYADAELCAFGLARDVVMVDTGGFEGRSVDPIATRVVDQTQLAIDEADVVVFLADGRAGRLPDDEQVIHLLRRAAKPVIVAVNKVDGVKQDDLLHDFYTLGVDDVIPISAEHGRNIPELIERVLEKLPPLAEAVAAPEDAEAEDAPIRVAVIGRPNAGKSSLINRILGEDRHLVSEVAGTTRDAIDSLVVRGGNSFLFIDTAGIRRKKSIALQLEKFSVVAALRGLDRSDVALLMLDATQDVADQDAKVSSFAYEKGKSVVLVVSKWDAQQGEISMARFAEKVRADLAHLAYAPIVFSSAVTGFGLDRLFERILSVHEQAGHRVSTGELNRFLADVMANNPPPSRKGRRGKIFYLTQIGVRPPRFMASVNDPGLFHFAYRRYLVNSLRERYGFEGVPVLVGYRGRGGKSD